MLQSLDLRTAFTRWTGAAFPFYGYYPVCAPNRSASRIDAAVRGTMKQGPEGARQQRCYVDRAHGSPGGDAGPHGLRWLSPAAVHSGAELMRLGLARIPSADRAGDSTARQTRKGQGASRADMVPDRVGPGARAPLECFPPRIPRFSGDWHSGVEQSGSNSSSSDIEWGYQRSLRVIAPVSVEETLIMPEQHP